MRIIKSIYQSGSSFTMTAIAC